MPYTPAIIVSTTPALQVSMAGNVSYNSFINSLGIDVYRVKSYYIKVGSRNQLQQIINYQLYDADGNLAQEKINTSIDPNQKQNSYLQDLSDRNIILNKFSTINLDVLPGENILMIFDVDARKVDEPLNATGKSNQQQALEDLGNGFFISKLPPRNC